MHPPSDQSTSLTKREHVKQKFGENKCHCPEGFSLPSDMPVLFSFQRFPFSIEHLSELIFFSLYMYVFSYSGAPDVAFSIPLCVKIWAQKWKCFSNKRPALNGFQTNLQAAIVCEVGSLRVIAQLCEFQLDFLALFPVTHTKTKPLQSQSGTNRTKPKTKNEFVHACMCVCFFLVCLCVCVCVCVMRWS